MNLFLKSKSLLLFTIIFFQSNFTHAQNSSSEIFQELNKLKVFGAVLYIAAHPDDENTRLLSYLANERKMRTGYLAITRGDGGQNLIGKEQGELLGIIRTQELLAARRTDAAEQFFTRANDFGYSKNPEETFEIWDKQKILSDVVWVIRNFKPDVIISRFPTTGEGGHGHHTASAILAEEAFEAAADVKKFPEQLKYVSVWKTERLFWNTFNFGETNTIASDQLKVNVGLYNPILGKSYGEIAAESRTNHKSQGFGSAKQRGELIEYFKSIKGSEAVTDLFENINTSSNRLSQKNEFENEIQLIINNFNFSHPEKSLSALFLLKNKFNSIQDLYWKEYKLKQLNSLIEKCLGLFVEVSTSTENASTNDEIKINPFVVCRNENIVLKEIKIFNRDSVYNLSLKANQSTKKEWIIILPINLSYSSPYYLEQKAVHGLYTVNDPLKISKPEMESELKAQFIFNFENNEFIVNRNIQYKKVDPVKGEIVQDLAILPELTIAFDQKMYLNNSQSSFSISATVHASKEFDVATVKLELPLGWKSEPAQINIKITNKQFLQKVQFKIFPKIKQEQQIDEIKILAYSKDKKYDKSLIKINYDHIPNRYLLKEASCKIINLKLSLAGKNIGYIPGPEDEVAACLEAAGYTISILNNEQILNQNLQIYDAIVFGIRAFNTKPELFDVQYKLFEYMYKGGTVVCQYNTNNFVGKIKNQIGPYPFKVSRDRVTDENAEIRILNSKDDLLNYPNKIKSNDFENWVQERGLYFPAQIDSNYKIIISCNDPNEPPLDNAIIYCNYGKGKFIYTSLSFFRELPAGVPGAYRLFANLIAGGKPE